MPHEPLGGNIPQSAILAQLLKQGGRGPLLTPGALAADVGTSALKALSLAMLRKQGLEREEASGANLREAFAPSDVPPVRLQGPPEQIPGQEPSGVSQLMEATAPLPAGMQDQSFQAPALQAGLEQERPGGRGDELRFPMSQATTRPKTTQEMVAILLQDPRNRHLGTQLALQEQAGRGEAEALQESRGFQTSEREAGQEFRAGQAQLGREQQTRQSVLSRQAAQEGVQEGQAFRQSERLSAQEFRALENSKNRETRVDAAKFGKAGVKPSSVREFEFFQNLPTQKEKDLFIQLKRANPSIDLGGRVIRTDPLAPGEIKEEFRKTPPPQLLPGFKENVAEATARGTIRGQTVEQARVEFPQFEADANISIDLLDQLVKHPGLKGSVGIRGPSAVLGLRGTDEANFKVLLDQVKGKQFLSAFESLKGGGHITEIEGEKATQAAARMDTAQSEEEFIKAAKEFSGIIKKGLERARKKAGLTQARRSTDGSTSEKQAEIEALEKELGLR